MEKTLANLRKECKAAGIKVRKQTLSWGPHLTFEIGGVGASNVTTKEHYENHKAEYEALEEIKEKFKGLTINGQKVYGLGK